jgi:hypothetical protein
MGRWLIFNGGIITIHQCFFAHKINSLVLVGDDLTRTLAIWTIRTLASVVSTVHSRYIREPTVPCRDLVSKAPGHFTAKLKLCSNVELKVYGCSRRQWNRPIHAEEVFSQ